MRFSIRDLLWATALVALCVAWWVDRHDLKRQAADSAAEAAAAQGKFEAAIVLSRVPIDLQERRKIEEMGEHWNDPDWWNRPERKVLRDMVTPNLK